MQIAIEPTLYPWLDYKRYSFSLGLKAKSGVYLSGSTAAEFDPETRHVVVKGGMTRQARTVYDKIGATLEAAGRSFADVVRVVEYVTREGFERYAEAEAVRNEVFGIRAPAVNTVPVARLLRSDAFIEIEVTAGDFVASPPGLPVARESAGMIYLPTILPTDDRGEIVSRGDVVGQTEQIFKNAEKLLARFGTDLSHVVMTVDYLAASARKNYKASSHVRMNYLGPIYPGAAGIVQPRLLHPDALVQYDIIATRDRPTLIDPGWDRYRSLSYSAGVRAGKLVFMSGQVAMDPVSMAFMHKGDIASQAEYTYGNILKVLEAAGGRPENLVKTVEFVTPRGLSRYREVAEMRQQMFKRPYPASTGVICEALLKPEMDIEVIPFAILD